MKNSNRGTELSLLDDLVIRSKSGLKEMTKTLKKGALLALTVAILATGVGSMMNANTYSAANYTPIQQEQVVQQNQNIPTFAENVQDGYSVSSAHYLVAMENLHALNGDKITPDILMSMVEGNLTTTQISEIGLTPSIISSIQASFAEHVTDENPVQFINAVALHIKKATGLTMNANDLATVIHEGKNFDQLKIFQQNTMHEEIAQGNELKGEKIYSVVYKHSASEYNIKKNHTPAEISAAQTQISTNHKNI